MIKTEARTMHELVAECRRRVDEGKTTLAVARERLAWYGASIFTGRDFGESGEAYLARRPDLQAFFDDRKQAFGF